MKSTNKLFILFFIVALVCASVYAQSENNSKQTDKESVLVTFECEGCTKRNTFKISGPENHLFIKTQFPIEQELKPGDYEMTYWQNKVQQIHLPFQVNRESKNVITVK